MVRNIFLHKNENYHKLFSEMKERAMSMTTMLGIMVYVKEEQEVIKTMDISHNAFQWEATNHSQCCKLTISLSKALPQNGCQYQCNMGKIPLFSH